jgi:hypothetical protein
VDEKKKQMQKLQEQASAQLEKYRQEAEGLRKRVAELEGDLKAARLGAEVEIENVKKSFSEELQKLMDREKAGGDAFGGSSSSPSGGAVNSPSRPLVRSTGLRPASASRSLRPGQVSTPMGSTVGSYAPAAPRPWSPTRRPDGTLTFEAEGAFEDDGLRQLLRDIDGSNSKTISEVKAMYDKFILKASSQLSEKEMMLRKVKKDTAEQTEELTNQRNSLVSLVQLLIDIVESGKTFPKHTGGVGFTVPTITPTSCPSSTDIQNWVKRARVLLREAEDPLRPAIPRSSIGSPSVSNGGVPGSAIRPRSARPASSALPPDEFQTAVDGSLASSSAVMLTLPEKASATSVGGRPSSAKPAIGKLSVRTTFSSSVDFGQSQGDDAIEAMDAPELRNLIYALRRQMGTTPSVYNQAQRSGSFFAGTPSAGSSPAPALLSHPGRPSSSADVSQWRAYAEQVEQERDAYRKASADETKKLHQLRVSYESLKRGSAAVKS